MHRAAAVLAEVDLVDVGVHDVRLLEARFENERHDRFLALAPQRAPAVEEIALHELLRQRAAALLDLPRAHVDEQRAQDRERVHAVVRFELAVLDGLQRLRQQRRDFGRRDDDPVLAVNREDAADQQRIEAEHRDVGAVRHRPAPRSLRRRSRRAASARVASRRRSGTRGRRRRPSRPCDGTCRDGPPGSCGM